MNITETIGMMSTGALLTLGVVYFMQPGGQQVPQYVVQQQPVQTVQSQAGAEVTRSTVDLSDVSPVNQIESIVALSEAGIERNQELTPEQKEVIAFFEDTAREMNQTDRVRTGDQVTFSNMAVSDLQVLYFYTVPAAYEALNHDEIMRAQTALVTQTLCQGEAIQTLMQDYGFAYTYTYVSADNRMIGQVNANAATCG